MQVYDFERSDEQAMPEVGLSPLEWYDTCQASTQGTTRTLPNSHFLANITPAGNFRYRYVLHACVSSIFVLSLYCLAWLECMFLGCLAYRLNPGTSSTIVTKLNSACAARRVLARFV